GSGLRNVDFGFARDILHIQVNQTDPSTDVDGERSSAKTQHPFLLDPAVKAALSLLIDRTTIQQEVLGRTAIPTINWLNAPAAFAPTPRQGQFDIDKANQILEAGGWRRGPDGIRQRNGIRLKVVFQTAILAQAQKI